jgi:anti-anti-sigma regulatory factor
VVHRVRGSGGILDIRSALNPAVSFLDRVVRGMDLTAAFCRIGLVATDDGATIFVHGDVDLASAPLLDAAFAGVDATAVAVDLSEMTFCDGAGLRVLEQAHQRFGPRLRVTGASPLVRRLAAVLEMDWLAADIAEPAPGVSDTAL